MNDPGEDFVLDPEAEASIDQIADGLRKYLRLLLKGMTTETSGGRGNVSDRE
jgi:hypothetical protein